MAYHFQTYDTATNDHHLLGHLLKRDGARTSDHSFFIYSEPWKWGCLAACGNEDILCPQRSLAAFNLVDRDLVFAGECCCAADVIDFVLLEQEFDALGETLHGGVLRCHHLLEIELDIPNFYAALLGVVEDLVVQMRVIEEGFRRYTANVQTRSA